MGTRAIIPSAGLGNRMSMAPHEAKELLIDPNTNAPLIDYTLSICKKYDLDPVVISRKEKREFNKYLLDKGVGLIILPELEGEWMDTVLKSSNLWLENNILLFPDTRFEPISIIQEIKDSLVLGASSAIGLHKVTDPDKWCMVKDYELIEKPCANFDAKYAFGALGFKSDAGFDIFGWLSSKQPAKLSNASFHYFTSFRDLTRTGKIE